ncbi:MAG: phosphate signaling complex protein PhoU [Bdellovibrionales bacterium]|nr:phosphate signaling complex protein PhoU [Bdellovibrionales bacterium]
MSTKFFDERLGHLKSLIASMGGCVEQMLKEANMIIFKKPSDKKKIYQIIQEREIEIDSLQVKLGKYCYRILAVQSPVAKDLRAILSIISANTSLERMGDLSFEIAKKGRELKEDPLLETSLDCLEELFVHISLMVVDCLDAFINEDEKLARHVILQDQRADSLKDKICLELKTCILKNKELIDTCIQLVGVAEKLERVGDQATNIAEEVVFLQTGLDIKHQEEK